MRAVVVWQSAGVVLWKVTQPVSGSGHTGQVCEHVCVNSWIHEESTILTEHLFIIQYYLILLQLLTIETPLVEVQTRYQCLHYYFISISILTSGHTFTV